MGEIGKMSSVVAEKEILSIISTLSSNFTCRPGDEDKIDFDKLKEYLLDISPEEKINLINLILEKTEDNEKWASKLNDYRVSENQGIVRSWGLKLIKIIISESEDNKTVNGKVNNVLVM